MVDRDLLRRKLADLEVLLRQLGEYHGITPEDYRRDWKVQRIVERTLQMAIETCLDIGSHAVADRGLKVPATYGETFDVLAAAGMLDESVRVAMRRMVGFRNLVVHEYAAIDAVHVVRILREHVGDLDRFAATARAWV